MKRIKALKVKNLSDFLSLLEKKKFGYPYVSFDIFDTLICRCIEPPELIHFRVSSLISEKVKTKSVKEIINLRKQVEKNLRNQSLSKGDDGECRFKDLVNEWVKAITGIYDKKLIDFVLRSELKLESSALAPKVNAIEVLEALSSRDIKIIAISDMYLNEDNIRGILSELSMDHFFHKIFISSSTNFSKGSGRLHKYVLEQMNINASEIIHIGDNLISDVLMPSKLNIQGVYLLERSDLYQRSMLKVYSSFAKKSNFFKGFYFFKILNRKLSLNLDYIEKCNDFYFNFGVNSVGPAFTLFSHGIIEKANEIKPEKIFFLARDGFIFHEIIKEWLKDESFKDFTSVVEYTYLSRKSVTNAVIAKGLTLEIAKIALCNPNQKGLFSIFQTFGLDERKFISKAKQYGFDDINEPIYDFNDKRLENFLKDYEVSELVKVSGEEALSYLEKYLEQSGFFSSKKVALVDIGWNGTIQKFLIDCFSHRSDFPDLHGWYFAYSPRIHETRLNAEGFMMNALNEYNYDCAPQEFEEIFEQSAKSFERTVVNYKSVQNEIIPVLKDIYSLDCQYELKSNASIDKIQQGVKLMSEIFLEVQKLEPYNFKELKPYVSFLLERLIIYPTNEEVEKIGLITHSEDLGQSNVLKLTGHYLGFKQLFFFTRTIKTLRKTINSYSVYGPIPSIVRGLILRFIWFPLNKISK